MIKPTEAWPEKVDLFGLHVSICDYEIASERIILAAQKREGGIISCHAAHAIVTFSGDKDLRKMANEFQMITPDGQPVRWAMNWLYRTGLRQRVYGPQLMLRVCEKAAEQSVPIFLLGGADEKIVDQLSRNLRDQFPKLDIVGSYSPPFREMTDEEKHSLYQDISNSGAQIVFIGLGCPKQDLLAFDNREHVDAVQICVGAAFDFHAGVKPIAPGWMQKLGLEWVFRLSQEPKRLWKRYLVTNSIFVWRLAKASFSRRKARIGGFSSELHRPPTIDEPPLEKEPIHSN